MCLRAGAREGRGWCGWNRQWEEQGGSEVGEVGKGGRLLGPEARKGWHPAFTSMAKSAALSSAKHSVHLRIRIYALDHIHHHTEVDKQSSPYCSHFRDELNLENINKRPTSQGVIGSGSDPPFFLF